MFDIKVAGENAIIIYFGDKISPDLVEKIAFYSRALTDNLNKFIIDVVPSYTTLWVSYKLDVISYKDFCQCVEETLLNTSFIPEEFNPKLIEIPVYYGLDVGLDLENMLKDKDLSHERFIEIHSSKQYLVYAIGFGPAFAFLGEVDQRISSPRLATPRVRIPAGSVGIADNQTAVYPIDSSGGWNIIGKTPLELSLDNPDNLTRFSVGDRVQFLPVDKREYLSLGGFL